MLMFKKEKRVVKLVLQHVEKTAECVQETTDRLKSYVSGDTSSWDAGSDIYSLESEADNLLREIRDLLYSGAYLPLIRGDIYRLMSTVDAVSNKAEGCFDFFHNQKPDIPADFRAGFDECLDLTRDCFAVFQEALEAFFGPKDKTDKIRKHCRAVGELESRIDEVERNLTASVFDASLDLSQRIHLSQALRRIAAISDAIENSADELELISLKSVI